MALFVRPCVAKNNSIHMVHNYKVSKNDTMGWVGHGMASEFRKPPNRGDGVLMGGVLMGGWVSEAGRFSHLP